MKTVNYSELRQNLKSNLDMVSEDSDILIVHRSKGKSVVMMSLDDFNSLQETQYLLSTKNNRERLLDAVDDVEKGKVSEKELLK
jgi:antitoxin YefM